MGCPVPKAPSSYGRVVVKRTAALRWTWRIDLGCSDLALGRHATVESGWEYQTANSAKAAARVWMVRLHLKEPNDANE